MERTDVIVVGGGVAGLTAAGLLAARGLEVALLEKQARPGGYVGGFERKGFVFDATGAFVSACAPGDAFHDILGRIGVADRIDFLPIRTVRNLFPDFEIETDYRSPSAYLEAVQRAFPARAGALAGYGRLTERLGRAFLAFETAPAWKRALLPLTFPTLLRHAWRSHGRVLHAFFGDDPRIRSALSALPTTVPPASLSYAFVAVLWAKVLGSGVFYPRGGMRALAEALTLGVTENGGRIDCGREVAAIRREGRRAVGVGLSDGTELRARWVVGAMNPFRGERLLDPETSLYGPRHRLDRYTPSGSALLYYVGVPPGVLPPSWPYFTSLQTETDPGVLHRRIENGELERGLLLVITTATVVDPSLAPAGHHTLKVLVHAPRADVFEACYPNPGDRDRLRARVFEAIRDRTGVDLAGTALFVEEATPLTLRDRTGNEGGAMYGLDASCSQVGPRRPPNRTALDRLFWAGHYTHPSHGIVGSALSGSFAARRVLVEAGEGP